MTEDEAKTKWCPAIRLSSETKRVYPMNNREEPLADDGAISRCIGSACMWWRWDDMPNQAYDRGRHGISGVWPPPAAPPMTIKSETDGHCGVAGKP